jgi:hypothetical protein
MYMHYIRYLYMYIDIHVYIPLKGSCQGLVSTANALIIIVILATFQVSLVILHKGGMEFIAIFINGKAYLYGCVVFTYTFVCIA